jgi:hypothetical protein
MSRPSYGIWCSLQFSDRDSKPRPQGACYGMSWTNLNTLSQPLSLCSPKISCFVFRRSPVRMSSQGQTILTDFFMLSLSTPPPTPPLANGIGGLLWTRYWTFRCTKRVTSWLAEWPLLYWVNYFSSVHQEIC